MSEVNPEQDDQVIGGTSQDIVATEGVDDKKKGLSVFDVMLMVSLLFITLATFRLVLVLREYNPGWPFECGSPWSTGQ